MKEFSISRIHTTEGIFRLKGSWQQTIKTILLTQLEIMATDGWQQLDLKNDRVINLIGLIEEEIVAHLL